MTSYISRATATIGQLRAFVLKRIALMLPLLLAAALPAANAVPLFCSDVAHFPERQLTGCALAADSLIYGRGLYTAPEQSTGDSQAVDDLLSQASHNSLVQVGRIGLTDEPRGGDEADKVREVLTGISGKADENSQGALSNTITKGENWYYMNIDPDGTYLFFGDLDQVDELSTLEDPEEVFPSGIGVGKKWRF